MGRGRSLPPAWQRLIKEVGSTGKAGKVYTDIAPGTLRVLLRMRARGILRLVRVEGRTHTYRLSPTGEEHYERFYAAGRRAL